jgi:hypothetical protein
MPPVTHNTPTAEIDLTLEEQWVVHVALLEYVEAVMQPESQASPPALELDLLGKIEAGDFVFSTFELGRLLQECNYYAQSEHIPSDDRSPIHRVIEKIDRLLTTVLQQ